MAKRINRHRQKPQGRLLTVLAGGFWLCFHSCLCVADELAPPVAPLPLVAAMESIGSRDLRLSQGLFQLPSKSKAGRLAVRGDTPLFLTASSWQGGANASANPEVSSLSFVPQSPLPSIEQGSALDLSSVASSTADPQLQLSQMMLPARSAGATPRWMTLPDEGTMLRQERVLTMPGAAGVGRPQGLPRGIPLAEGESGEAVEFDPGSRKVDLASAESGQRDFFDFGLGWTVPPVRSGGSVGYSMQKSSSGTASSSTSQGLFASVNASSFIYAPWFATVTGRFGITNLNSSSSSAEGAGESTKSSNIVGGGEVNMFSSSRFPFRAYYDRADSRGSGSIVSNDYINTRYGMRQNYRSEDGADSGNLTFDRSEVAVSNGQKDSVTALSGGYATQTGIFQHNVNGRYSLGERNGSADRVRLLGFNTSHAATIDETLSLNGTVNYSDSDILVSDATSGTFSSRSRYLQLNGFGSWMPEFEEIEDLPLTLNGGIRYNSQMSSFGGASVETQNFGLNLSGLYRFSRNFTASANSALTTLSGGNTPSRVFTLLGSNLNYVGDPLSFGNYSYNWNVGGNGNWQSGSGEVPSSYLLGLQASHSVSRVYSVAESQTVSLNVSQSINEIQSQLVGASTSLSNTFSANYGLAWGEGFSGSLSGMLSDVKTKGYNEQEYTTLGLGFVGMGQLSQQSSANLNLMLNWSDQTNSSLDAYGAPVMANTQHMTMTGSANYNHMRFLGVRGLRYNFLFTADTRLRDDRLYGNTNSEFDRARLSMTNRVDYQVGLLNFRLSMANNDVGGKKNALLFFQVTRQIGTY